MIHGDCMDLMRSKPDNYYGLAIVDPPYGIGKTWSKSRNDRFYKQGNLHSYKNEKAPQKEYFNELVRVSKNQIIWGGNYFTKHLRPTNAWVVWNKKGPIKKTFMSEAELAWTSFSKILKTVELDWNGCQKCEKVDKTHPHQKPVLLYEWLILNYAKNSDKILDTHGGSFSAAIASYNLGFDLDIIEIEEKYFQIGTERVLTHVKKCEEIKQFGYAKTELNKTNPTLFQTPK